MTITLLSLLAAFLAYVAWIYRCDYRSLLTDYNAMAKDRGEVIRLRNEERTMLTHSERKAWEAYKRSFLISLDTDKARIAAEEHAKQLRLQIEELQARLEAAEREEADTEICADEGTAEEAGAVQAENGHGQMVRDY